VALIKQPIDIRFTQSLETKQDPWQIPIGKFLSLVNSVFTTGGRLSKRNGYAQLPSPTAAASYATTFQNALTAIGPSAFESYDSKAQTWRMINSSFTPTSLSTLPAIRNALNQSQADIAQSTNGLLCIAYTETGGASTAHKYVVIDSDTGQTVLAPAALPNANATYGTPRCFFLAGYFIVLYTTHPSAYNLSFIAINISTLSVSASTTFATSVQPSTNVSFDGVVVDNTLYVAWSTASAVKIAAMTSNLAPGIASTIDNSTSATQINLCADYTVPYIWVTYCTNNSSSFNDIYVAAMSASLGTPIQAPNLVINSAAVSNVASVVTVGGQSTSTVTVYYELPVTYTYDTNVNTNHIKKITSTILGGVGSPQEVVWSVGLASKPFIMNGVVYFLAAYQNAFAPNSSYQNNGNYQPTYFLINASLSTNISPVIVAKLAYGNGGGYVTTALPNTVVSGTSVYIPYLFKDLISAVNKGTNLSAGTQVAGIYSQTGVNVVTVDFEPSVTSVEIGNNLNVAGGYIAAYDGQQVVEQSFHLWPDNIENSATASSGGHLGAYVYWYQVTYEWTDNQGNVFRSAPSIPISVDLSGSGTSTNTVTLKIPTLRLTAKTTTPVNIVVYRWSTNQQNYYQTTSISSPLQNDMTVNYVTFVDTNADATILGNNLLYTTGGVVENIGPPAFSSVFLFDDRMWGIDAEDGNLLWNSKQVIEATPVEFSDLLTTYVAPSTGAQGPTGKLTCGFPMDDKAILFKKTAISYINGTGPDNTGANSQYSQPIFITSVVGCSNQNSIVFTPNGLMFEFQSESGNQIWLLGRDLSTRFIGAPVSTYTQNATVLSAVNIPGANHVRFTLSSGYTIFYDYFYDQWGTFIVGGTIANSLTAPASSTLWNGLHTFINAQGAVYQEAPGIYVDGSVPVLMSFQTGWLNLAGLQGYERLYWMLFLGNYLTPFKLAISLGYNYNQAPEQQVVIAPDNYNPNYGDYPGFYGAETPYGGNEQPFTARVFNNFQRCQAFQITAQEIYDPSFGVAPGAGLTLSGLTPIVGIKKGYRPSPASKSFG